jgi:hypothetical protein
MIPSGTTLAATSTLAGIGPFNPACFSPQRRQLDGLLHDGVVQAGHLGGQLGDLVLLGPTLRRPPRPGRLQRRDSAVAGGLAQRHDRGTIQARLGGRRHRGDLTGEHPLPQVVRATGSTGKQTTVERVPWAIEGGERNSPSY